MAIYTVLLALFALQGAAVAFAPNGQCNKKPLTVTSLVRYGGGTMIDDRPYARSYSSPYYGGDYYSGGYGMDRYRGGYSNQGYMTPSQGKYPGWDTVQGGALRTFSFGDFYGETVEVQVTTEEASPIDCNIDLWEGPDFSPVKIRAYAQDGSTHPLTAQLFLAPYESNSVAVRNTGPLTFPAYTRVQGIGNDSEIRRLCMQSINRRDEYVQGGSQRTFQFAPGNDRAQILLRTEGRPLNARIELLQGPNNNKMTVDVYSHDGVQSPVYLSLDTMGRGNAVRVVNLNSQEFPLSAVVEAVGIDGRIRPTGMGNSFGYDRYASGPYGTYGQYDRYGRSSYGSGIYSNNSGLNGRYGSGYGLGSPFVDDYSSYDSAYGRRRQYYGSDYGNGRSFGNSMSSRYWYE